MEMTNEDLCLADPQTKKRERMDINGKAVEKQIKRARSKDQNPPSDSSTANAGCKRSSIYRGVTRHKWTGRYEAHLWDRSAWNTTQNKKGKQVYLGAYDEEESAARAYDLAALKYWGPSTLTNFPVTYYARDIEEMQNMTREEYLVSLRRKSSGFSRGVSKYRGVARHHHNGRWEARIGRVFGNKYLYLGTYNTQEEAAAAYDMAAIEYRGLNAVTNFDLSRYIRWLRPGPMNNVAPSQIVEAKADHIKTPARASAMTDQLDQITLQEPSSNRIDKLLAEGHIWHREPEPSEDSYNGHQEPDPFSISANINTSQKNPSPVTALSLLLQSSLFRQMLEKTSHAGGEHETADLSASMRHHSLHALNFNEVESPQSINPEYGATDLGLGLDNLFTGSWPDARQLEKSNDDHVDESASLWSIFGNSNVISID